MFVLLTFAFLPDWTASGLKVSNKKNPFYTFLQDTLVLRYLKMEIIVRLLSRLSYFGFLLLFCKYDEKKTCSSLIYAFPEKDGLRYTQEAYLSFSWRGRSHSQRSTFRGQHTGWNARISSPTSVFFRFFLLALESNFLFWVHENCCIFAGYIITATLPILLVCFFPQFFSYLIIIHSYTWDEGQKYSHQVVRSCSVTFFSGRILIQFFHQSRELINCDDGLR